MVDSLSGLRSDWCKTPLRTDFLPDANHVTHWISTFLHQLTPEERQSSSSLTPINMTRKSITEHFR